VRRAVVLSIAVVLLLTGCASPSSSVGSDDEAVDGPQVEITISAAASLGAAFEEIAEEFELAHPDIAVNPLITDGSSVLATQIIAGAEVDIFASADENNMQKVRDAGLIEAAPERFASNTLVVATPTDNPADVNELADLARPDLALVVCAPEVPCGAATQTLLENAGVVAAPVSLEQNVTAVLTKVATGEADAGIVYATDVQDRADLAFFVPDGADSVVNDYPIAALADSQHPDAAAAFVAFVTGEEGQAILASYGFGPPRT